MLRKVRQEFTTPDGKKQAIELLGAGQQYVVAGLHRSGGEYEWLGEHPCDMGAANLPAIDTTTVDRFFDAVRALLTARGCKLGKEAATSAALTTGPRKPLMDKSLWCSAGATPVLDILAATNPERFASRDELVQFLAAVWAALGPNREDYRANIIAWALQYPGAEEEFTTKILDSFQDAALGWDWLSSAFGSEAAAQADFDDGGPATGGPADENNVLEKMLARYVYSVGQDRYFDLTTGTPLTTKGFNAINTGVAQFGRSGVQSAEGVFQNTPKARKVATLTYRPGAGTIVKELVNGIEQDAVNTYRPSPLKPAPAASDDDVKPWLDHISMLFGVPGAPACGHILNYMAFVVQNPGVKVNHSPVVVGEEGVGKDTAFEPLRRALGEHNTATIGPEELTAPFNSGWIDRQFLVINEAHTFKRRETMDKLKPLIAAPPNTLLVNRKNVPQYPIPNLINVAMFTNHEDAMAPTQGDRRYWIHRCLIDKRPPDEHFAAVWAWFNAGGDAKCFAWLLRRDVAAFNPKSPATMTAAKQDMIDQSAPAPVRWLRTQFENGGHLAGRSILTVKEVTTAAEQSWGAPTGVSAKYVANVLKLMGFHDAGRVRVFPGEEGRNIWVRDPSGLLGQQPTEKLRDQYRAELAAARSEAA